MDEQEKIDRYFRIWLRCSVAAIVLAGVTGIFVIGYGLIHHNPF